MNFGNKKNNQININTRLLNFINNVKLFDRNFETIE